MNLSSLNISDLSEKIRQKSLKAEVVFDFFLNQAKTKNKNINAYISLNEKGREKAFELDKRIERGEKVGLLAGIPVGVKDMICTKDHLTTAASKMLAQYKPSYSATVIEKLESQDAILLGKCNQDEFAMGSSTLNSYFGSCKNPWNTKYVSGGSSGGSAASVAAGLSLSSLGTDTGGSIRQPAHFCGVVGIKPTYGRVSRHGVIAFASSLDQVGTFGKTVKDAALTLEAISGYDTNDSTSANKEVPKWSQQLNPNVKNLKIGVIENFLNPDVPLSSQKVINDSVDVFKKQGAIVDFIKLDHLEYTISTYYLIATAEACSNLSRYDGVKYGYRSDLEKEKFKTLFDFYSQTRGEGFGAEVKRRILMGNFVLSKGYYEAYYQKACEVRTLIKQTFKEAFKKYDCLLSLVNTKGAFKEEEYKNQKLLDIYFNDTCTASVNLAGLPALTVPVGFNEDKMPLGVQLIAPDFKEQTLFDAALCLEKSFQFYKEFKNV